MQVSHEQLAALAGLVTSGTKIEEYSVPGLRCYPGSLTAAAGASWLAVDAGGWPLLLRIVGDRGDKVEQFPFASSDHQSIRHFAQHVEPKFLPRPQGAQPAVAAGDPPSQDQLPAGFRAV